MLFVKSKVKLKYFCNHRPLFRNVYCFCMCLFDTFHISDKLECSNDIMIWDEAQDYCMNKGGEMMVSGRSGCTQKHDQVTGQWMGLRRKWRLKSVNKLGK